MKITNSDLRAVIKAASKRGWSYSQSRGGHIRLSHPTGGLVFTPSTPSDHRAIRNLEAALRRAERRT